MNARYDTIMSLGANCVPQHQIERYFANKTSSIFSWLCTPWHSIEKIFADDGERFSTDFRVVLNGTSIQCEHYGVLYHHEFPRDKDHTIKFSPHAIASSRARLQFTYSRMLETIRETSVLFIRYGVATLAQKDPHFQHPLTDADVLALETLLAEKLGHDRFHVAIFEVDGHAGEVLQVSNDVSPRVSLHKATFTPTSLGDDNLWDEFFAEFGFEKGSRLAVERVTEADEMPAI